jgi:predicted TIM-barrel fold metal-dependent hydrolase
VPISMQAGHILEAMLSEHARPVFLNRIACDFPDLPIIGTHRVAWKQEYRMAQASLEVLKLSLLS